MEFKTHAVLLTAKAASYKLTYFMTDGRALSHNHRRYTPQIDILMHRFTRPVYVCEVYRACGKKLTYPSDLLDVVGLF
jgi:hypothetical protein